MNTDRSLLILALCGLILAPYSVSAQGAIEGTVTFWGDAGGGTEIEIGAFPSLNGPPDEVVYVPVSGGAYSIPISDGTYYVAALMAPDGNFGPPRPEDVFVWYDANGDGITDQVTVSGGAATGIDIDLGFVYVDIDATGGNNGSSWSDAFTDLQDGIDLAVSGIDVWVAEGTYVPGTNRTDSFLPKPGVRVCGGFTGTETNRTERDWNAHPAILSGEIGSPSTTADNSYHVFNAATASPTAILDGVTITAGRADGTAPYDHGAGVQARGGGVTLANATVSGNYATTYGGGAAALLGGTIKAYNTYFTNNTAQNFEGGGYYANIASAQPQTLVNCVFTGNYAWRGGGVLLTGAGIPPVMVNLSLSDNTAGGEGGGLHTNSSQSIVFVNSIFWDNTSNSGVGHQISAFGGTAAPTVNYGIVEAGWATGSNILDVNPSFADAELRINLDSPAIDAGDTYAVPPDLHDADGDNFTDGPVGVDRDFHDRFVGVPYIPDTGVCNPEDEPIDMGAYEAEDYDLLFFDGFESGDTSAWSG
jgi:hypothetical protein